jgi:hypothetical protein
MIRSPPEALTAEFKEVQYYFFKPQMLLPLKKPNYFVILN